MTYLAFVLEEQTEPENDQGLHHWMVWVQSPNRTWLLLEGSWPTSTSAVRFIDRTGYQLIGSAAGLTQLDKQREERQRTTRPALRSVH